MYIFHINLQYVISILVVLSALFSDPAHSRGALNSDVRPDTLHEPICIPGYTKAVRPSTYYTDGVKRKLLRERGLDEGATASQFELDHIIPLALGGHPRHLANLELHPWAGVGGARHKDRLEVKLQCLVCSCPSTRRYCSAGDWQAAYHLYSQLKCNRHKAKLQPASL